jgi:hypothetical protein
MTQRKTPDTRDGTQRPFRRYALAATGALATTGVAGTANAEFVYYDVPDVTASAGESIFFNMSRGEAATGTPTPEEDQLLNWNTSVTADYSAWRLGNYAGGSDEVFINDFPSNVVEFEPGSISHGTANAAAKKKATRKKTKSSVATAGVSGSVGLLLADHTIDNNSFVEIDNHFDDDGDGEWDGGGTGFIGLKMLAPGGGSLFGWARLTYDDTNDEMTLHDFAFSSSPINAGQSVPEPSTLALLALGAAGLGTLRSRRKRK